MKIKTSELTGATLDWAVSKCEELEVYFEDGLVCLVGQPFDAHWRYWNPSIDWAQGGSIIEREGITVDYMAPSYWEAETISNDYPNRQSGTTPLIAAMRCYVASKLGDEVEVPEGL